MRKFVLRDEPGSDGGSRSDSAVLQSLADSINTAYGDLAKATYRDNVLQIEVSGATAQFGDDGRLLGGQSAAFDCFGSDDIGIDKDR